MKKENNIVKFPSNLSSGEREVEAILFAAAEPLEISTIETGQLQISIHSIFDYKRTISTKHFQKY